MAISVSSLRSIGTIKDVTDAYGDHWDLYLWRHDVDDYESGERRHTLVWHALAPGSEPTADALGDVGAHAVLLVIGNDRSRIGDHDLGHAYWRSAEIGMRTGERPFRRGTESHARIVEQSLVALDALLAIHGDAS